MRLKALSSLSKSIPPALQRAATLLERWQQVALSLPVYDLLDLILHEGQLLPRYAQATSPLARDQTIRNIESFVELAIKIGARRHHSLPKFIDNLRTLRNTSRNGQPNEENTNDDIDAVNILTIHSAKGLEAPVVAILDANHSEPIRDDYGILCDWPEN